MCKSSTWKAHTTCYCLRQLDLNDSDLALLKQAWASTQLCLILLHRFSTLCIAFRIPIPLLFTEAGERKGDGPGEEAVALFCDYRGTHTHTEYMLL